MKNKVPNQFSGINRDGEFFTDEDSFISDDDDLVISDDDEDVYCDLDPTKVCNNCFKCLESDADYEIIEIDGIYSNGKRIF